MIGGFPPLPGSPGNKEERQLLKLFKSLGSEDRQTLLKFASFLQQQAEAENEKNKTSSGDTLSTRSQGEPALPRDIPRPDDESVIKAIKRLNKAYYMVDSSLLLDKTSDLMTQHILQGRDAKSVIDDLEVLFKTIYEHTLREESAADDMLLPEDSNNKEKE